MIGEKKTSSIGAWPNSFDWRPPKYCIHSVYINIVPHKALASKNLAELAAEGS
jgi:hypothetical protein